MLMSVWVVVALLFQIGDLSTLGKYPFRIDYQILEFQGETPERIRGTLWVLGNLYKSVLTYPDGVTQVDLYDGSQWWLYASNAPGITPMDRPPVRSVLAFFAGGEVPLSSEKVTELTLPRGQGKILIKGIRSLPGLGPVPETVVFTNEQGKPVWKITITSVKQAPEISDAFFQKSTLPTPETSALQARDKEKNPVWDY